MGWRWGTPQKRHGTGGSIMGWRWGIPMLTNRHLFCRLKDFYHLHSEGMGKVLISQVCVCPHLGVSHTALEGVPHLWMGGVPSTLDGGGTLGYSLIELDGYPPLTWMVVTGISMFFQK